MENNTAPSPVSLSALLGGLLLALFGGWLVGMAAAVAGSILYINIVFPVGMGIAGSLVAEKAAKRMRLRSTLALALLAVVTAAVVYGTSHYGRYLVLQAQSAFMASSEMPDASLSDKLLLGRVMVDYGLREETGRSGFPGYMLYKAKSGVPIGRFYHRNRDKLTGGFAWLYWAGEFALIVWLMKMTVHKPKPEPTCDSCGREYSRERHVGGTAPVNESLLLDLLRRRDVIELGRLIEKDAGLPSVELYMQRCEACGEGAATVTVRRASLGTRGNVRLSEVSKATLRPGDSALFLSQLRYKTE